MAIDDGIHNWDSMENALLISNISLCFSQIYPPLESSSKVARKSHESRSKVVKIKLIIFQRRNRISQVAWRMPRGKSFIVISPRPKVRKAVCASSFLVFSFIFFFIISSQMHPDDSYGFMIASNDAFWLGRWQYVTRCGCTWRDFPWYKTVSRGW